MGQLPSTTAPEHADDLVQNLPPAENKSFYPALDGMRAVAILLVFFFHYVNLPIVLRWGWVGVDIFFVLSGFLITGILYDTRFKKGRFKIFYIRRTLRIFPLYYGVLFGVIGIGLATNSYYHWIWHPAWYLRLTYLSNMIEMLFLHDFMQRPMVVDHLVSGTFGPSCTIFLEHLWSLSVEEQFYLVWPFVVFLVKDRTRLMRICLLTCAACLLARLACAAYLPHDLAAAGFSERFGPLRADSLLMGGFIALAIRGPEKALLMKLARPVLMAGAAFFLFVEMFSFGLKHHFYLISPHSHAGGTFGLSLLAILAAAWILRAIDPASNTFRLLNRRWLRRLGQISYGFYILHELPHMFYSQLAWKISNGWHPGLIAAPIGFVATLILALLSYRFFETPFLRLKERFTITA